MRRRSSAAIIAAIVCLAWQAFGENWKRRWPHKPPLGTPIRTGHPTAKGLVGYWTFGEGGGEVLNLVSKETSTAIGGPAWGDGRFGRYRRHTAPAQVTSLMAVPPALPGVSIPSIHPSG